jgi:hypothetical protein
MPNAPVHFEIPADDVARARTFYERTFGWTFTPFPMGDGQEYYIVVTRKAGEPGIDGGLMKRNMPGQPFTNYISVKSIDAMNQTAQANGATVVLPKQEIGQGMGWISAFMDPENNIIGLHEMGPAAPRPAAAKQAPAKRAVAKKPAKKPAKKAAKKAVKRPVKKTVRKVGKKATKKRR